MIWIGWTGTLVYLLAQLFLALNAINKRHYTMMNAVAALLVSIYSIVIVSIQPIIINVLWSALSAYALYHKCFHHQVSNRKLCALLISVGTLITFSTWGISADLIFSLSIVSIWIYSAAYVQYLFFGLKKLSYFLACVIAPSVLLPQLWIDGNYPVVAIQIFWLIFSAVGVARCTGKLSSKDLPKVTDFT